MHLGKVFLRNHRKSIFRCARAGSMFACSVLPTQDSVLKLLQKTVISLRNWIALHPTYILLYLHYYSRHTKMKERAIAWLRKDFINAPYFTFHLISHISAIPFCWIQKISQSRRITHGFSFYPYSIAVSRPLSLMAASHWKNCPFPLPATMPSVPLKTPLPYPTCKAKYF